MPRAKPVIRVFPGAGGRITKSELNRHDNVHGYRLANPGNVYFNSKVEALKAEYLTSKDEEKKHLAAQLVEGIRNADPPGRFLKKVGPDAFEEIGDEKAWQKTMAALRKGAPQVRKQLAAAAALEILTPVEAGRRRGQDDISGNVEEQPQQQRPRRFLAMAQQCVRRVNIQNNVGEEEEATSMGEGDAEPSSTRTLTPWMQRYEEVVEFKDKYKHTRVPQNYFPNPPLGRWVQKQRTEYSNRMQGRVNHLNDEKLELLQDIGFVWNCHSTRNNNRDTTYNVTGMLPDLVEGFCRLEQDEQEVDVDDMLFHNARTLFATAEKVRKRHRRQISKSISATFASADNTAQQYCGLGDLNYDTLKTITTYFRKGDGWKQKMSLVCSEWRRAALRLDSCTIYDLSPTALLNVFDFLELPQVVSASQTCRKLDDLLSRALLHRSELLPCRNDPQWSPLFQIAEKILENANDCAQPLFAVAEDEDVPKKYGGFLQCEDCGRQIAHPPSRDGTKQKYKHICCPPECNRGVNEIHTIADCVSRSGNLNSDERNSIIDELVRSSAIPEAHKKGRYFKVDANSPELNIEGILSEFFIRIISQGESFEKLCQETYTILGRRQQVLLSLLIAYVAHVGPCKVGSTGSGVIEEGKLIALPRTQKNGSESYPNGLFIREAAFAAMEFGKLGTARAGEGFLIAAGSLLGAVVNKKLEHGTKSASENTMIYFVGLRTESPWEYCLNHARLHYDFGRRLLCSNGEESEGLPASSEGQALSGDERQALEQQLALERDERQALEQQLARERQSKLALERELEKERRANEEARRANEEEQQRNIADFADLLGSMQALQLRMMKSNNS